MGETDDSAWVFDSLIGFLQGPIWSTPLLTFIEEKSLAFEPDNNDCKVYRDIYQEYKNLVDLLLGCYMEDMGITPEQFERACLMNRDTRIPVEFQQSLFEQIWAANEYEVFKRMMIQKNLELQLQALNIIEEKQGVIHSPTEGDNKNVNDFELPMDDVKKEMQETLDEHQELVAPNFLEEHERLAAEYRNETALLEKALNMSLSSSDTRSTSENLDPGTSMNEKEEFTISPSSTETVLIKNLKKTAADESDIKQRQLYLKSQRDKLVALKKQVRSQKLSRNTNRPSSARVAAEAAIIGNQQNITISSTIEPSILQVRKALAARLKSEVVEK